MKQKSDEFKYPAARMQAHFKGIAHFVEKAEYKTGVLKKVNNLPPIWVEKILIVDDSPAISSLLKDILNRDGDIDIADNGKDAIALIEKKYYKLVISDIDMPVMDGMTLFKKTIKSYPKLQSRFLFMTGNLSPERQRFFTEHEVACLVKPFSIQKLKDEGMKILISA